MVFGSQLIRLEEKTKIAVELSTSITTTDQAEEKISVANALNTLAVSEEEVFSLLFQLINDPDPKVQTIITFNSEKTQR